MKKKQKGALKQIKKKNHKAALCIIAVMLLLTMGGFAMVSSLLVDAYRDTLYPANVLVSGELDAFARTMPTLYYKPLKDIAIALSDEGNGVLLNPIGRSTVFDYNADVLAKLTVSNGSGRLIVRQGSGDIESDVLSSTPYYYDFMGKIDPSYQQKVYEKGILDNYASEYSAGYIKTNNFIKKSGYYVAAVECRVGESGRYLFIVYATESLRELEKEVGLIKDFATLAMEGDYGGLLDDESADTAAAAAEGDDLTEWNEYYEAHFDPDGQPVSSNVTEEALTVDIITVSGNDTTDENAAQEESTE